MLVPNDDFMVNIFESLNFAIGSKLISESHLQVYPPSYEFNHHTGHQSRD